MKQLTTIEDYEAALSKVQRDYSEALLMLSRLNEIQAQVLRILVEKGTITRTEYQQIHSQAKLDPPP